MAAHQVPPSLGFSRQEHWVAIFFSNAGKWKVKVKLLSRVWLLATPRTTVYRAPPSMGFSRQEFWSGVPLPATKHHPSPQSLRPKKHHIFLPSCCVVTKSCPTVCNTMDCSLPGPFVHENFQARILEWVGISFSNAWKWKVKVKLLSRVRLLATPWTSAYQAPPSMGFSRQ